MSMTYLDQTKPKMGVPLKMDKLRAKLIGERKKEKLANDLMRMHGP